MTLAARVVVARPGFALDAALEVGSGEVVALVGPNGAGKTTLLRALAGLEPLAGGRVALAGRVLEDPSAGVRLPPEERGMGIVFQDGMLFPHLTALDNVAFGLRAAGAHRGEARRRAGEWLERLGSAEVAGRLPSGLSGGEAQRVALARALAVGPRLLALDEPLSALDVEARGEVRRLLAEHLAAFPGPALVVTHDPVEALTLAGRLVVLEAGRVVQEGDIGEVARRPRSEWAARLLGVNLYRGRGDGSRVRLERGVDLAVGGPAPVGPVFALIRPQAVSLHVEPPSGSPRNVWPGRVASVDLSGDRVRVLVEAAVPVVAEVTPAAVADLGLVEGRPVWAVVKASEVETYPD